MPLYPLIEAGVFKAFGAGVLQMRALPVAFGFFLLLAVFAVGREAADERVAALAVVLMVALRVAAIDGATGIVLLDRARINRNDIAGTGVRSPGASTSTCAERHRAERQARGDHFAAGALVGLASLSHLYGVFWLPIFAAIVFVRRGWASARERSAWSVFAGFACSWIPWGIFVASGWSDYRGQMMADAPRFDLLNPVLLHLEPPIRHRANLPALAVAVHERRADLACWNVDCVLRRARHLALIMENWRRDRAARKNDPLFALTLAAVVQVAMFAVLLTVKTYEYMIALWPFGGVVASGVTLKDLALGLAANAGTSRRPRRARRPDCRARWRCRRPRA